VVSLTIDGKRVRAPEGATVLEAAARAGIEIPHLCTQEGMSPYGACRLCTVEIAQNGRTRLQAACSYPVAPGLEVRTNTPRVVNGRRIILEFLLARCPEVKAIRDFARRWGVKETRFETREKDDCILCGLCVRACSEVVGAQALGFLGRGVARKVEIPFGRHPESCIGCGLCAKQGDVFRVEDNLARLNYEKYQPTEQTETAFNKCPTGVILCVGKSAPQPRPAAQKAAAPKA